MRKLNKKNKISFNIFGGLVVVSLALIIYTAFGVFAAEKEIYTIGKDSIVYDDSSKSIDVASAGNIEKKWNGNYYLSLENGGKYNLGEHNVFYDQATKKVGILGDGYQVFTDGSVSKIEGRTDIADANEMKFYKLADRKYLISGLHIQSQEEGFDTSNYLYIQMDKSGNALLLNNEVNMKTINPMILVCGDVEFDIANETLKYKEEKVNLKAINGSTNEYQPPEKEEKDQSSIVDENEDKNQDQQVFDVAGGSGGTGGAGGTGGTGGTGGSNNSNQNPGNNNSGNGSNQNPIVTPPKDEKIYDRTIALRSVKAGIDSLSVDYYISDVENKFIDVHLLIEDEEGNEIGRFQLNKSMTNVLIRQLAPNEKYTLSLNYSMYYTEKGVTKKVDYTADETNIRTKSLEAKIEVNKIGDNSLTYHVYMDDEFVLNSAEIHVYLDKDDVDGEPDMAIPVDIDKAIRSEGWEAQLPISKTNEKFQLVMEKAIYNGEPIDLNVQCTVYHERNQSIADFFMGLFK